MVDWLKRVQNAVSGSTTFLDANFRKQWEDNISAFNSKHHSASKYNTGAYKWRSKIYRPKTRATIRNNEAAASAAFFTNNDVADISAVNPGDRVQQASAEVMKELLQYRLTKTIPWYLTLLGGFQDANVIGVVISYQSWKYRVKSVEVEVPTDIPGVTTIMEEKKVIEDCPSVEIIPVENLRIHPGANWVDPINSSPYITRIVPMYAYEVRERMAKEDEEKIDQQWNYLADDQLASGTKLNFDSTRLVRESGREDPLSDSGSNSNSISDYDIVWVFENFMKDSKGEDQVIYTLGMEHLLTDPTPIEEVYFTGERPIAMGVAVIETHKIFPSAPTQLGQPVQREINEVTNSRLDNVKLALNKRYFVKRGAQVDLKSILRNVAGSITFIDEDGDVTPVDFNDVTSSSYEEETRLSTVYDEVVGNFSQSSIANNRRLNETVGGMQLLKAGTMGLTEYLLRTFSETWVKTVLWQLIKLEQKYETDVVVLSLAGERAKIFQKYGIDEVTDELLNQELTLEVNVGTSATDPATRVNQFMLALKYLTDILRDPPINLDIDEVQKEVFGRLGYKDGTRFFRNEDNMTSNEVKLVNMIEQLQAQLQQALQELENTDKEHMVKLAETNMKEKGSDRRTDKTLATNILLEHIKLKNPVQGEKV